MGALDLYRHRSGPLSEPALSGGLWAARLAARPLLDLMTAHVDWQSAGESEAAWEQLASLERVEVYQATGVLIAALDVPPAEALVRLRAYAIGHFHGGRRVSAPALERELDRWPRSVPAALAAGFSSVHAVPMRLRDTVLGALGLFGGQPGSLNAADLRLAQGMADVASIALVQERAVSDQQAVNDQLQLALTSRVVLEQAKGVLSHTADVDMPTAFALLRRYARDHNLRLSHLAHAVVHRMTPAQAIVEHSARRADRG